MILDHIVEQKRKEVNRIVPENPRPKRKRSFLQALKRPNRQGAVIAEIKKASPSKGTFIEHFDPVAIARAYEQAGADALSVLTDQQFFQGDASYIKKVKSHVSLPVLRKDFIIDQSQIDESANIGADAILLIAAILSPRKLIEFHDYARSLGLDVLVEVHSKEELHRILQEGTPELIGVNNRDLQTFKTNLNHTKEVAKLIPPQAIAISESGIHSCHDVERVLSYGAKGMLIGESLMLAADKISKLEDLFKVR
nr:indole-3-glycerol phosphate synthase TrpC [Alteribacter populi]